jgi:rod shape-determining protein MreD
MLFWLFLIFLALFLQSSVFGMFPFLPVKPDIILIILMYAAFTRGEKKGAFVGFAGGLAEDFFSGGVLGVSALVKTVLGYVLGSVRKKFEYGSKGFQFISVFAASCISQAGVILIMKLSGNPFGHNAVREVFFPASLLNAVLGPFVFYLIERVDKYGKPKTG